MRRRGSCVRYVSAADDVIQPTAATDVLTYRYDVMRTGQNLTESVLTPSNVASRSFGSYAASWWMAWSTPSPYTSRISP